MIRNLFDLRNICTLVNYYYRVCLVINVRTIHVYFTYYYCITVHIITVLRTSTVLQCSLDWQREGCPEYVVCTITRDSSYT